MIQDIFNVLYIKEEDIIKISTYPSEKMGEFVKISLNLGVNNIKGTDTLLVPMLKTYSKKQREIYCLDLILSVVSSRNLFIKGPFINEFLKNNKQYDIVIISDNSSIVVKERNVVYSGNIPIDKMYLVDSSLCLNFKSKNKEGLVIIDDKACIELRPFDI